MNQKRRFPNLSLHCPMNSPYLDKFSAPPAGGESAFRSKWACRMECLRFNFTGVVLDDVEELAVAEKRKVQFRF